jgi:hypothetical protein
MAGRGQDRRAQAGHPRRVEREGPASVRGRSATRSPDNLVEQTIDGAFHPPEPAQTGAQRIDASFSWGSGLTPMKRRRRPTHTIPNSMPPPAVRGEGKIVLQDYFVRMVSQAVTFWA